MNEDRVCCKVGLGSDWTHRPPSLAHASVTSAEEFRGALGLCSGQASKAESASALQHTRNNNGRDDEPR
ncbi:hypothetical protein VUR80DRAFT_8758 [Thermomyces stellatus]